MKVSSYGKKVLSDLDLRKKEGALLLYIYQQTQNRCAYNYQMLDSVYNVILRRGPGPHNFNRLNYIVYRRAYKSLVKLRDQGLIYCSEPERPTGSSEITFNGAELAKILVSKG